MNEFDQATPGQIADDVRAGAKALGLTAEQADMIAPAVEIDPATVRRDRILKRMLRSSSGFHQAAVPRLFVPAPPRGLKIVRTP